MNCLVFLADTSILIKLLLLCKPQVTKCEKYSCLLKARRFIQYSACAIYFCNYTVLLNQHWIEKYLPHWICCFYCIDDYYIELKMTTVTGYTLANLSEWFNCRFIIAKVWKLTHWIKITQFIFVTSYFIKVKIWQANIHIVRVTIIFNH